MRIESSVTAVSWIPSEAITAKAYKIPMEMGVSHWDDPLPDHIDDLIALRDADKFRIGNVLKAWVDVSDGGEILNCGYSGGAVIGSTTLKLGKRGVTFAATAYPDLQQDPVVTPTSVTFVQTCGGCTGAPMPRRVSGPPFVQWQAPTAWSTLSLTINNDGTSHGELTGASPFPRHWVYDNNMDLVAKTGIIDFKDWFRHSFDNHSPWGDQDSPAFVTTIETALERELNVQLMKQGRKPKIKKLKKDDILIRQGEEGRDMFVLLDGMLEVSVDGKVVAELGPGAVLGERALLEGGLRTSTHRAMTAVKVAVVAGDDVDPDKRAELAAGHKREDD